MSQPVFSERAKKQREFLQAERARLRDLHRQGGSGRELARAYAEVTDRCVVELYNADLGPQEFALAALGGYGRGELSPFSDIEICLIHRGELTDSVQKAFGCFLRDLWDMGAIVSHTCFTVEAARQLMEQDVATACSLLDARHLAGSKELFAEFKAGAIRDYLSRFSVGFVRRLIDETARRHADQGNSELKLEPNLKTGVGGLRDYHTVLWLRRTRDETGELVPSHLLDARDIEALRSAYDFVLRVRAELHYQAGRKQDVLLRDLQPEIATRLGFADRERIAVEEFMQSYYTRADTLRGALDAVVEEFRRDRRYFAAPPLGRRPLGECFVAIGSEVYPLSNTLDLSPATAPERLLDLFLAAQRGRLRLSKFAQKLIRDFVETHPAPPELSRKAASLFLEILRGQGNVGTVVREMHNCAFLGWLLPDFKPLTRLVQFDYYHEYTADEHSLKALETIDGLLHSSEPARDVLLSLPRTEMLFLALLVHDIGRARGSDHARKGAAIAERICRRLHLDEPTTELIRFLVLEHLRMSHLAHRRDFSEEQVIEKFARSVQHLDTLKYLYLLTYADIKSVGRGAWREWQGELLYQLYYRTAIYLQEEPVEIEDQVISLKKAVLAMLPADLPVQEVEDFFAQVPARYFVEAEPESILSDVALLRRAREKGLATFYMPRQSYTSLSICTRDRSFLFADISGALTGSGMNVVGARAYTRPDGWILDIFSITDAQGHAVIDPELLATIDRNLERVLSGSVSADKLVSSWAERLLPRRKRPSRAVPEVFIDNETSGRYTVVDVLAPDQIGLLFKVSNAISSFGLDIHFAKISTDVDRAVDVFYITTREGHKFAAEHKVKELRAHLLSVATPT